MYIQTDRETQTDAITILATTRNVIIGVDQVNVIMKITIFLFFAAYLEQQSTMVKLLRYRLQAQQTFSCWQVGSACSLSVDHALDSDTVAVCRNDDQRVVVKSRYVLVQVRHDVDDTGRRRRIRIYDADIHLTALQTRSSADAEKPARPWNWDFTTGSAVLTQYRTVTDGHRMIARTRLLRRTGKNHTKMHNKFSV